MRCTCPFLENNNFITKMKLIIEEGNKLRDGTIKTHDEQ